MPTVSINRCDTYELEAVRNALLDALAPLGGIKAFVKPGQRVLLKPNLLMPVHPRRAITTHPAVVEALVELVQGAGGDPFIVDSPGGPLHVKAGMRRLYQDTGLRAVAEQTGVALLEDATAIQVPVPDGLLIKRLDLLKVCQEVDVIISVPKLKTHGFATITGAVKNLFGLVPGMIKPAYHAKLPSLDQFCDMLLDIVACVKPALCVMDGILALEGSGPSLHGTPRHVGIMLASQDAVALDATVCQIIGLDPDQVALFRAAARRGWWPMDIAIAGTPIAEVAVPDFRLPESAQSAVRRASRRWIAPWATRALVPYPLPRRDRCTACRTCQRTCPVQAIDIVDRLAVVDYDHCIRCYCCHEMCPEAAIDLQFSLLGRIIRWTGMLGRQTP